MNATEDDGTCVYDTDGDGIIDTFEQPGCTDVNANNHNSSSTDDDGSCDYDEDDDGVNTRSGSGTGSTAIALAKMLEPATMVATDQNEELINLIHENAQANAVASHSSCTRRGVASRRCASSAANSAQLTRLP